jgi:hypothetical protein
MYIIVMCTTCAAAPRAKLATTSEREAAKPLVEADLGPTGRLGRPQVWAIGDWFEWKDDDRAPACGPGVTKVTLLDRARDRELYQVEEREGEKRVALWIVRTSGERATEMTFEGKPGEAPVPVPYAKVASECQDRAKSGWIVERDTMAKERDEPTFEYEADEKEIAGFTFDALRIHVGKIIGPASASVDMWATPDVPGRLLEMRGLGRLLLVPLVSMSSELVAFGHVDAPTPVVTMPPGAWPPSSED